MLRRRHARGARTTICSLLWRISGRGKSAKMNLPVQLADPHQDRRRANRAALRLSATMREAGRGRVQAKLIDISTHGCRVECASAASADAWIWLSIAGLETQYCRVVWRQAEFAGLEFVTPLAEPVLERLLSRSAASVGSDRQRASRHRRPHPSPGEQGQWRRRKLLAELSDRCAVEAVIEGLKLGEAQSGNAKK